MHKWPLRLIKGNQRGTPKVVTRRESGTGSCRRGGGGDMDIHTYEGDVVVLFALR